MDFIKKGSSLLMVYEPEYNYEEISKKLNEDGFSLKNTFNLKKENISSDLDISEDKLCFKIGELKDEYYLLDSEILSTEHNFFLSSKIKIERKLFVAFRNISIFRKLDKLVVCDIYITESFDNMQGHIPYDEFKILIDTFPNSTELTKYKNARISQILANYVDGLGDITMNYEKYLNRRSSNISKKPIQELREIRLELFKKTYDTLRKMLNDSEGFSEVDWQMAICDILCIVYPKYVMAKREVTIGTDGRHKKIPDFILVDSLGFIDVLEIKKPTKQRLLTNTTYRNNYVADRDLAGAIVQIEKYIYTLSHSGTKLEEYLQKRFSSELSDEVVIRINNPQGMLLMGRSNELSDDQKFDLEIIKRQHKNIIDIMTYDDLLERLKNIIARFDYD